MMSEQSNVEPLMAPPIDKKDVLAWISKVEARISTLHEDFIDEMSKGTKKFLFSIAHYKDEVHRQVTSPILDAEALTEALSKLRVRIEEMRASIDSDDRISKEALSAINDLHNTVLQESSRTIDLLGPIHGVERNSPAKEVGKLSSALQIIRQQLNYLQNDNNRSRQAITKNRNN